MQYQYIVLALFVSAAVACSYGNMDADCSYTTQDAWDYMLFVLLSLIFLFDFY